MSKNYYVTMTDKFMSGWGMAEGKKNKLVIECETFEQAEAIERAAQNRPEMRYVNICTKRPSYNSRSVVTSSKTFADMGGHWLYYYRR